MKARDKGVIAAILLAALFMTGICGGWTARAEAAPQIKGSEQLSGQTQNLQALEQASESLYQAMQNGRAEQAQLQLERITSLISKISYQGLTGVDGIHELTACVLDARTAVLNVTPSPEVWSSTSARLRLAVDSLLHAKGAMWLQYYKVLQEDSSKLDKAVIESDPEAVQSSFQKMKDHYEMIRPAAVIQQRTSEVTALDSWMSYIGSLSGADKPDLKALQTASAAGKGLFQDLFGKPKEEPVLLPITGYSNPWQWSFLIGVWILLALGYTAYRKYSGEQEVRPVLPSSDKTSGKRTW
ncbi:sporulation protein YpjB [Paenibacillus pinistramenti]|uniref:sporulation protein YpjB n=1 Tax=Paenibacillus pinistramenti TaxID=1768003 RepID=UPI00110879B6|nr:sporulation protein YpjB [Paenibacillus pinistramenti]